MMPWGNPHLNITTGSMSLKANLSIILQLHSFRNLALPHKARYALQVHLYQGKSARNVAMPFNILETDIKPRRNVGREGFIDDHYFRSKCFNIEYQDQEIELNDCCEFKMVVEGFPTLDDSHFYLEFILLENNQCYFRENMDEPVDFKEAERYRFRLENLEGGIVRYHEGEFCKTYVSSFAFSLFLMVTDYRFHPFINHNKSESSKDRAREKVGNLMELMDWAGKYLKNWDEPQQFYAKYVKNLRYNSVLLRGQFFSTLKIQRQETILEIPKGQKRQLVVVSDKEFFEYVTNYQPELVTEQLMKLDIYQINQENFYFFQTAAKHIARGDVDIKALKQKYRTERRDLFAQRLFRTVVFGKQPTGKQQTGKLAHKLRKHRRISDLKIIDQHLFSQRENQHYAMLQVNLPHSLKTQQYEASPSEQVLRELSELRRSEMKERQPYDERNMVIFFCHGFQASSFDMEMLKREVGKMLPTALLHASTCNQMDTDGDIALMGLRLADEVVKIVQRNFEDPQQAVINFIGHSMGGIIARACLAHIPQFRKQFGFFFSLSTPHLGYLNGVDAKIKAGLWFMRKMNKVTSLDQLALEDSQSPKETLLFKLSQTGHLKDFQKIILLSSSEDSYVPWHSARTCYPEQSNSSSRIQREMVESILGDKIVHRVDVHFDIDSTKDIDSFIGRAAHIHLLTQECIFKLINQAVPNLFDIREL